MPFSRHFGSSFSTPILGEYSPNTRFLTNTAILAVPPPVPCTALAPLRPDWTCVSHQDLCPLHATRMSTACYSKVDLIPAVLSPFDVPRRTKKKTPEEKRFGQARQLDQPTEVCVVHLGVHSSRFLSSLAGTHPALAHLCWRSRGQRPCLACLTFCLVARRWASYWYALALWLCYSFKCGLE